MANLIGKVLRQTLLKLESAAPGADADLLDRFVTQRDEAAFAEIVRLHGPMVWRVCQRVLRQTQDAEDAFQATFVILARKADGLAQRNLLGGWLHGVAHRVSLEARKLRGRRDGRRRALASEPAAVDGVATSDADWRAALDEEITRLPARYRLPLVLCDLEGKTSEATGRELGIPAGTVRRRLSHVREQLRQRLARRGIQCSSAALPALLASDAQAALTNALAASAVRAAVTPTQAGVAESVLGLVQAYLAAASWRRFGVLAVLALLVGLGGVSWWLTQRTPPTRIAADAIHVRAVLRHDDFVYRVAFAPDGKSLFSSNLDGQVWHWDAATGQRLPALFKDTPFTLAISPDGQTLAAGSWFGSVQLWDVPAGREILTFTAFDFIPAGNSWELKVGMHESLQQSGQQARVGGTTGVCFSPDGQTLAVGREKDARICLYDVAALRQLKTGKRVAIQGTLTIFPGVQRPVATTWRYVAPDRILNHERMVRNPAFSPDGQSLAATGLGEVVIWDVASGRVRGTITGHPGTVTAVQFSADGKLLATAGLDGTVKVWRSGSLREQAAYSCQQGITCDIAFAPDSQVLGTAGTDGTVKLWNLRSGAVLAVLRHGPERVNSLAFAPDGRTLATAGFNKTVKLWNLTEPK